MSTEVTPAEREAVKQVLWESVMEIECLHCWTIFGAKDGRGATGKTSSVCPSCKSKGLTPFL